MGEIERLDALAEEINTEHRACEVAVTAALDHAMRAGDLLAEVKSKCPHGTWQAWLENNFEGSVRTAQVYMRAASHRREIEEAKAQTSAPLSLDGALKELAAPTPPEDFSPEERAIVKHATKTFSWATPNLERLAALREESRRGFVAEMAWQAMVEQGKEYRGALNVVEEKGVTNVTPELLTKLQDEANKLRWWVAQVEWIETLVRACDYPPGRGMPRAAFDEEKKHLPLSQLYSPYEDGLPDDGSLPSPRARIREFCGPVV